VRTDAIEDFIPRAGAIRRYTHRRVPKPPKGTSGVVGLPAVATAEKGERIFRRWVRTLEAALRDG
jgi:creatinine amidohydrolase/Fe(II)-dependent formamide hydrolase-like protein